MVSLVCPWLRKQVILEELTTYMNVERMGSLKVSPWKIPYPNASLVAQQGSPGAQFFGLLSGPKIKAERMGSVSLSCSKVKQGQSSGILGVTSREGAYLKPWQ